MDMEKKLIQSHDQQFLRLGFLHGILRGTCFSPFLTSLDCVVTKAPKMLATDAQKKSKRYP